MKRPTTKEKVAVLCRIYRAAVRAGDDELRNTTTRELAKHGVDALAIANSRAIHPVQPVAKDDHGVLRFKSNAIVRYMADTIGLNELAKMQFPKEDWQQLAQLIGYSVDGYSTLSYVDDAAWDRVIKKCVTDQPG